MQANHISVVHGNMEIDVPRKIFIGSKCEINVEESEKFMDIVRSRYPWITVNSYNVLINKARMEMMRVRDEESNGREYSAILEKKGKTDEAIEHLRQRLAVEPNDYQTWYKLAELLMKKGDMKAGYEAYHKADSLCKNK